VAPFGFEAWGTKATLARGEGMRGKKMLFFFFKVYIYIPQYVAKLKTKTRSLDVWWD
jgi:hypothetical protein